MKLPPRRFMVWLLTFTGLGLGVWHLAAGNPPEAERRAALVKQFEAGNFKDAYQGLRALTLDPACDPAKVGADLQLALRCLERLAKVHDIDEYREAVIKTHAQNWRLLFEAAKSYITVQHDGFLIAGKFERGGHRGGGQYMNASQRDRVRALQLMQQGLELAGKDDDKVAAAEFHFQFANYVLNGPDGHEPWRLQYLTDLTKLPDYDEGYRNYGRGRRGGFVSVSSNGAPVDADGTPVYHLMPKSYAEAKSDGERWRWLLAQTAVIQPSRLSETEFVFANFMQSQLGVQTMGWYGARSADGESKTGTYALHTLKETETIAKLATGVKRFSVPDEFNWIKVYFRIADREKSVWGERSLDTLGQLFEDRRQYVRAAEIWTRGVKDYGPGVNNSRQQRLEQIIGNWGRFETGRTQPAGAKASVDFRFRNGSKVSLEAHEINVEKILADVKAYLAANPGNRIDWQQINIGNLGYRLVEQNQAQYLGAKVASWDMDLKPRPAHVDDRVTITTPLQKPGAYLLTAKMADGNVSRVIVWVADTIILKKQLDNQVMYFVADAATGRPVPNATVEFFGWRQVQVAPNVNQFRIETQAFNEKTSADGQVFLNKQFDQNFQWLVVASKPKTGADRDDRFAYMGFTGHWFNRQHDPEYNTTRAFVITDRPVYRPEQVVNFKAWIEHSKYDMQDNSAFAGQTFRVEIHNPKGEKIVDKDYVADEVGGLWGETLLPRGATLGVYQIIVKQGNLHHGNLAFRVEEYKKPEFDVKIAAPTEPVKLGDTIEVKIESRYYFGAPVAKGTVKYKVMRTSHSSQWFPAGRWDWMYGTGYGWLSNDYDWYPGFGEWGCRRPYPWWWHRQPERPEVVLESEVPVGADGVVKIAIDTKAALEMHGNQDHQYSITAEVVDESRRTIVGTGTVLVSRKPFMVYSWVDRGHYRAGDTIHASFNAQTLDRKPVQGKGELTLYQITYDAKNEPVEKAVETWKLDTTAQGRAEQQIKAAKAGQFRLSYKVTDAKNNTIEGGYVFLVRGDNFTARDFRFNDIELVADRKEYAPGDKVKLAINTNQADSTVLLFARPTNGVYLAPKVLRLQGKSIEEEIAVAQRDMPNFFVEAVTISGGRIHSETREVIVPPEKRILNIAVEPSQAEYKPGQKATVKVKITDQNGKPFQGSTTVSIYDKSVEYISGGSNVPEIKEFFWKWRRSHSSSTESSLSQGFGNLLRSKELGMSNLGRFGDTVVEELGKAGRGLRKKFEDVDGAAVPAMLSELGANGNGMEQQQDGQNRRQNADAKGAPSNAGGDPAAGPEPTVRRNFADTAFWKATLNTDANGMAEVALTMPENLTAWKIRVWAMGQGTRVGQAEAEVVTKKDLIVRLQAPRFFTQKDEVVLSANVHNYLKAEKNVRVVLEYDGGTLSSLDPLVREIKIAAGGEQRVDWRVKVVNEGEAVIRMKAISDVDGDAMEMRFPCFVHGMSKMESFSGVIRPDKDIGTVTFNVPVERRIADTILEVRYSPSLAAALVDALPYLNDYPYGCTEQTLNRFLPTVMTQRILQGMKLDLKEIQKHRTNLNAQEIGDDRQRIKGWQKGNRNPVFDEAEVVRMSESGVKALAAMQLGDGGWGWFSGFGERSYPHTTAVVVHGLQFAKQNDVVLPAGMLERGVEWLKGHQAEQVRRLQNWPTKTQPYKPHADNVDAFVYMVLVDANVQNAEMRDFLYRDRVELSVYAKAMFGLTLHKNQEVEKLAMILKNIEQFVVVDDENQTAHLHMPESNQWWNWHGSEVESNAYYLKLLAKTNPRDTKASGLVKYLLNNRRHATYWNSTRDTAICIEAMADYLKASGEDRPDMTVEIWLDGKKHKEEKITTANLFTFDNKLVLVGDAVKSGKHTLEVKRKGSGPVYFNAYLTNFTLEDFITRAGLEIRVNRKVYKLTRVEEKIKAPGSRGQALDQAVEKYARTELANLAELKSGDLVEVELEIESKNDYEYVCFEDPKAAGFEPMLVRSGYVPNSMGAYMELRDEKVTFFVRHLARGRHSLSYRLRAEIPGNFSAMPTRAFAMYAPELRGNSDEIRLRVRD
jgi:uncharacterized protein YfaS (alpha-2-macroglobulin family)